MATVQLGPNWKAEALENSSVGFFLANPVIPLEVLAIERDTGKAKIGDGVTKWNALPFITFNEVTSFLPSPADIPKNALTIDVATGGLVVKDGLEAISLNDSFIKGLTWANARSTFNSLSNNQNNAGRKHVIQLFYLSWQLSKILGGDYDAFINRVDQSTPPKTVFQWLTDLNAMVSDEAINQKVQNSFSTVISDGTVSTTRVWSSSNTDSKIRSVATDIVTAKISRDSTVRDNS
jgi:hypothetical protein